MTESENQDLRRWAVERAIEHCRYFSESEVLKCAAEIENYVRNGASQEVKTDG